MRISTVVSILSSITLTQGFSPLSTGRSSTQLCAGNEQSRSQFLQTLTGTVAATVFSPLIANAEEVVKLPSGTSYEVVQKGSGPQPIVGELAAIRFKAEVQQTGNKIDDIFDTPEPYYTRVGSGGLLKVGTYYRWRCYLLVIFIFYESFLNSFFLIVVPLGS